MPIFTSYAQGTPNWVDLQTSDQDAAKAFYAGLFGWTYDDQPMPQGPVYSMAMLGGHHVAAIAPQSPELAAAGAPPMWNTYLAVDSVDEAVGQGRSRRRQGRRWRRSTSWTPGGWPSCWTRPARRWRCGRPASTSAPRW